MTDFDFLNTLADLEECDGECDVDPPYTRCPECQARSSLNELSEIARTTVEWLKANNNGLAERVARHYNNCVQTTPTASCN
jgi:hypothetical protein